MTAPAQVRRVGQGVLEVTIHEGRNRQVRRMCDAVGHPVRALERVAFGRLKLGELAPGASRRLSEPEVERLRGVRRRATVGAIAHVHPVCALTGGYGWLALKESASMPQRLYALRGAISASQDDAQEILSATTELMRRSWSATRSSPSRW